MFLCEQEQLYTRSKRCITIYMVTDSVQKHILGKVGQHCPWSICMLHIPDFGPSIMRYKWSGCWVVLFYAVCFVCKICLFLFALSTLPNWAVSNRTQPTGYVSSTLEWYCLSEFKTGDLAAPSGLFSPDCGTWDLTLPRESYMCLRRTFAGMFGQPNKDLIMKMWFCLMEHPHLLYIISMRQRAQFWSAIYFLEWRKPRTF